MHPLTIGYEMPFEYRYSLIYYVALFPSIIGIWKSMNIKSKLEFWPLFFSTSFTIISYAFCPFSASTHTSSIFYTPAISKTVLTEYLLKHSSSTINIFLNLISAKVLYFSYLCLICSFFFFISSYSYYI